MVMWQCWEVRLSWTSGRSHYERSRSSAWPVGVGPLEIILGVAGDPDNGCDLAVCRSIECTAVGDPFESNDPPPAPKS